MAFQIDNGLAVFPVGHTQKLPASAVNYNQYQPLLRLPLAFREVNTLFIVAFFKFLFPLQMKVVPGSSHSIAVVQMILVLRHPVVVSFRDSLSRLLGGSRHFVITITIPVPYFMSHSQIPHHHPGLAVVRRRSSISVRCAWFLYFYLYTIENKKLRSRRFKIESRFYVIETSESESCRSFSLTSPIKSFKLQ